MSTDPHATHDRAATVPHEANYAAIQSICEEWKQACSDDECRCAILEAGWRLGFEARQNATRKVADG